MKRVLLINNNCNVQGFLASLLRSLDFEVYLPKQIEFEQSNTGNTFISFSYDETLSVSEDILRHLNELNFYGQLKTEEIALLGNLFDVAICPFVPSLLRDFCLHFPGNILIYAEERENASSSSKVLWEQNIGWFSIVRACGKRFWYGAPRVELLKREAPLLKEHGRYLPLPVRTDDISKWEGGNKHILFMAPRIKTDCRVFARYKNFAKEFRDMPYVIGGEQLQSVAENEHIISDWSPKTKEESYKCFSAMLDTSTDPFFLPEYVSEAVRAGMPLLFMVGSAWDKITKKQSPGRCRSLQEAKKKAKQILEGDRRFIKNILAEQGKYARLFTEEYARPYWEKLFSDMTDISEMQKAASAKRKIGIVLPEPYTGGVLDYALRFVLGLYMQIKRHGDNVELVFAYMQHPAYEEKDYFRVLRDNNIQVRSFVPEIRDYAWVKNAGELAGYIADDEILDNIPLEVGIIKDGGADFQDCDYLFFMADAAPKAKPLLCIRPYAIVAHDYIQRYVPEAVPPAVDNLKTYGHRHADYLLVTSKPTLMDAINHSGLPKERIVLTPLLLETDENQKNSSDAPAVRGIADYFLWSTNAAPHKNHLLALQGLKNYYQHGGQLECVVTGANTIYLNPDIKLDAEGVPMDYVARIRRFIKENPIFSDRIHFMGNMEKEEYRSVLQKAKFVFHPGYGDNGNGTILDAALVGVPSLCSDYPAARYFAEFAGLRLKYMNPFQPDDIGNALIEMETQFPVYAQELPTHDALKMAGYRTQSACLYNIVKEIVGFPRGGCI